MNFSDPAWLQVNPAGTGLMRSRAVPGPAPRRRRAARQYPSQPLSAAASEPGLRQLQVTGAGAATSCGMTPGPSPGLEHHTSSRTQAGMDSA